MSPSLKYERKPLEFLLANQVIHDHENGTVRSSATQFRSVISALVIVGSAHRSCLDWSNSAIKSATAHISGVASFQIAMQSDAPSNGVTNLLFFN